jgi:hypothetical protein
MPAIHATVLVLIVAEMRVCSSLCLYLSLVLIAVQ